MAKDTIATLREAIDELREYIDEQVGHLNNQLADMEQAIENATSEAVTDGRKRRGRQMTDEQRAEAGRRLQQARAEKLGLDSIEQLRALRLRPGTKPTKAQIAAVKKEFPVAKKGGTKKASKSE